MKAHLQRRIFPRAPVGEQRKTAILTLLDKSMRSVGTGSVVAGMSAAALGMSFASSYLIAAGVLLHLASGFGDWWGCT